MEEAARRTGFVREAAGERFAGLDLESSPYWCSVTDDVERALEQWAGLLARAAPDSGPDVLRDHPNVLVGPVGRIVEQLQERRELTGVNYVTVPRTQLRGFAPVVAELTGR